VQKLFNSRFYDLVEVGLEFWQSQRAITIKINAIKDLLGLNAAHFDAHCFESTKQFINVDLIRGVLIKTSKQVSA